MQHVQDGPHRCHCPAHRLWREQLRRLLQMPLGRLSLVMRPRVRELGDESLIESYGVDPHFELVF